ncbi:MAG: CvpA family protein [Alloprevotella sp.]
MIDAFILILVAWAAFSGWRAGFLKEIVSTVGILVGLFVAATCYSFLGEYLAVNGSESNMMTSIVAFFLLWIIIPIALGLVANMLTKALKGMELGIPNSILGMLVSVAKFLLLLSCVFNAMDALGIMNEERTKDSALYRPVAAIVSTFVPETVGQVLQEDDSAAKDDTIWVDMTGRDGDSAKP